MVSVRGNERQWQWQNDQQWREERDMRCSEAFEGSRAVRASSTGSVEVKGQGRTPCRI